MRKAYGRALLAAAAVLTVVSGAKAQPGAKPGPEIEHLKQLEGTWDATIELMGAPSAKGTMVYKMEMGGLWLVGRFKGDFGGAPFSGTGLDSYDPVQKKYVSIWVDSMSTVPMVMHGDHDASTHTTTMTGKGPGPDGKPVPVKTVLKYEDKDNLTFTLTMGEGQVMTIRYKRKS
jgi:hypothetical protein